MKLDNLRCLCAVIEEGGFRAAAARLHRSQPAVSQQVRALEREVGHMLVERRTGRLTPVGERLYERARHLLNEAEALTRELADLDETADHELRVGTSDTTALYFLPPIVRHFAEAKPQARLVLVNRPSAAVADEVARGDLDLGLVTLPVDLSDLEAVTLFRERFALVTPEGHPLAGRPRVLLAELADVPVLLLDQRTRTGNLLMEHFRQARYSPRVVLYSGSFEVIKRYVAEGAGVSFLPEMTVRSPADSVVTVRMPELPEVTIGAVWRRGAYRSQAEKVFLELIRKYAGKLSGHIPRGATGT